VPYRSISNLNALVAVSKGVQTVKLSYNKNKSAAILHWGCLLTQVAMYNGYKMIVVVVEMQEFLQAFNGGFWFTVF